MAGRLPTENMLRLLQVRKTLVHPPGKREQRQSENETLRDRDGEVSSRLLRSCSRAGFTRNHFVGGTFESKTPVRVLKEKPFLWCREPRIIVHPCTRAFCEKFYQLPNIRIIRDATHVFWSVNLSECIITRKT